MKTGVYIGRFNPPHIGHMNLIKKLLNKVDKLIIVVGSGEKSHTKENPFSGKERVKMMRAFLKEEKIPNTKVQVYSISDRTKWGNAVDNLIKTGPKFDVLFTNKKLIIEKVNNRFKIETFERKGKHSKVSATRIRQAIHKDKDWEHLTGRSVARLIKRLDGIKRIKKAK